MSSVFRISVCFQLKSAFLIIVLQFVKFREKTEVNFIEFKPNRVNWITIEHFHSDNSLKPHRVTVKCTRWVINIPRKSKIANLQFFSTADPQKKIFFPPKSANGVHNTFVISRNRLIVSSEIAAPGNFRRQKLRSRGTRRRNVLAISSIDKCGLMLLCLVGFVDYIPVGLWVKYWNQAAATKDESIELNEN